MYLRGRYRLSRFRSTQPTQKIALYGAFRILLLPVLLHNRHTKLTPMMRLVNNTYHEQGEVRNLASGGKRVLILNKYSVRLCCEGFSTGKIFIPFDVTGAETAGDDVQSAVSVHV